KYAAQLAVTRASAAIVAAGAADFTIPTLRADNPYLCFAHALALFHRPLRPSPGIHPTAVVAASASVAESASIGAYVVIGERAVLGPNATLHPHVTIYPDVAIGSDFVAHAGVVVR